MCIYGFKFTDEIDFSAKLCSGIKDNISLIALFSFLFLYYFDFTSICKSAVLCALS